MVIVKTKVMFSLFFVLIFLTSCTYPSEFGIAMNTAHDVKVVDLNEMPLRDKIAQMIMIEGKLENLDAVKNLNIGGIFLFALKTEQDYFDIIGTFNRNTKYPLFVATDLEGCVNMLENVQTFTYFNQIKTEQEAYELGVDMGLLLKKLGFTINFAPVLDLEDTIWKCRSFKGGPEEVTKKGLAFINGLNSVGILSTAKHFPGRTLDVADTHKVSGEIEIVGEDISPFYDSFEVPLIMLNHLQVNGLVDSKDVPSSLSPEVVGNLRENGYDGLIITDDLNMKAVSSRYNVKHEIYVDAINAGNDILLHVYENDPVGAVDYIEIAVIEGRIDVKTIDKAVSRILVTKGVKVVNSV